MEVMILERVFSTQRFCNILVLRDGLLGHGRIYSGALIWGFKIMGTGRGTTGIVRQLHGAEHSCN